jgi:hypothetical protein
MSNFIAYFSYTRHFLVFIPPSVVGTTCFFFQLLLPCCDKYSTNYFTTSRLPRIPPSVGILACVPSKIIYLVFTAPTGRQGAVLLLSRKGYCFLKLLDLSILYNSVHICLKQKDYNFTL